jgi:hypothetical protein
MRAFRRRLASWALALTALQLGLLFAAPVSACCARAPVAQVKTTAEAADQECCPAGSHPPGECPLHKNRKSSGRQTSQAGQCRMLCDAAHGQQFVFAAIGVLPAPAVVEIAFTSSAIDAHSIARAIAPATFPDAPPPKSL